MSDSDYVDAASSNSDGSSIEEDAAARTSKKTRYHSPRKQSNRTDIASDLSALSFKGRNAMLDSNDESDDDSEAIVTAPARARAAGKGRNVMLDSSDESDDDFEAPAPARRAAGNLKTGDESDSDASSTSTVSVSNFQFGTGKNFKMSDLDPDFVKETKHWFCLRPFTGQFSKLPYEDKKEMKEIFEKYEITGDDVGKYLAHLVVRRRKFEMSFLKSEDDTDFRVCRFTRSNGVVHTREYDPSFSQGLQIWHDLGRKTHAETMKQLFDDDDAQALIKKWNEKGEGEPNLRDMALGRRYHVTYRAISEANTNRVAEGRGIWQEAFTNGMDNDMEDVFGGRLLVRLYEAISGGMMGVQSHFNVSKPGQSPFHGFTILSGAGVLADNLMENYSGDDNTNWGYLLRGLRTYGVREDICNTGRSNDPDLGHINNRKFIFYHEHFRADGFEELKNVRGIKNQMYQD